VTEDIGLTLTFGNSRKEGSYTFTVFDIKVLINLATEMCREFAVDVELLKTEQSGGSDG